MTNIPITGNIFETEENETDIFEKHADDPMLDEIVEDIVVQLHPDDENDPEYHRGFAAGGYFCDNTVTKEDALGAASDLKCEAFKRGFGDGYRHMGSCNGDVIPGEDAECDDAAAGCIRQLEAMQ
jgi:hypothetical protein